MENPTTQAPIIAIKGVMVEGVQYWAVGKEDEKTQFILTPTEVYRRVAMRDELVKMLRQVTEAYINSTDNGHEFGEAAHRTLIKNALDVLQKASVEA